MSPQSSDTQTIVDRYGMMRQVSRTNILHWEAMEDGHLFFHILIVDDDPLNVDEWEFARIYPWLSGRTP